jgi:membrane protein
MFAVMNVPWHRQWIDFAKALWRQFNDDDILNGAAVLAFFFLLAAFPAAIFVLSLLPSLSVPHLQQAIVDLLHQVLPEQSANLFEGTIRYAGSGGKEGLLTFGLIFALWSGSSGVYAITEQLNAICDHTERRPFWKARGMAILLAMFFAVLTIGTLSLVILGGTIQSWMASVIGWSEPLRIFFATVRWIILTAAGLLGIAVAYRYGPDLKAKFRFVSPGNAVAAALIASASVGFRFYVSNFGNYGATYGNLASIIVLMLWMYLAGIAVLVGYEVNKIWLSRKPY